MKGAALVAALLAGPALAQDDLAAKYGPLLDRCYAANPGTEDDCIGVVSKACTAGEPHGETTLGMTTCAQVETAAWDKILNSEYRATRDFMRAMDDEDRKSDPGFAVRVESLRKAERAWIAFRDAECGLEYAVWGAGSMRNVAASQCLMSFTAQRAIELRAMREPSQ